MEAQNEPTPTGQLALPTWAKSSFFVLILHSAIYGHMWHFSICAQKTLRRSERKPSADSKIIVSASPNIYWSNKKDLNGNRRRNSENDGFENALADVRWNTLGGDFSPKRQKSFVLRTQTRFLIQIFFIGPEIHYTLRIYMISRHCSSLLVLTRHFSSFSAFLVVRKKRGKFLKMSSKDEQWRVMTSNHIIS